MDGRSWVECEGWVGKMYIDGSTACYDLETVLRGRQRLMCIGWG